MSAMKNTYNLQIVVLSACLVPTMGADAAVGFVAFAKQSGTNVIVDVFVAVSNAVDRFLSVESVSAATSVPANVGWYSGDPTSIDNRAESLIGVAGIDLGMLLAHWGPCTNDCVADMTGDGFVDGADLGIVLHDWAYCPG